VNNLVGTNFLIDETDYRIVDERDVDGVVMVYAEPVRGTWGALHFDMTMSRAIWYARGCLASFSERAASRRNSDAEILARFL